MIDIYKLRNRYWPAYTWKIQTSCSKDIKDNLPTELKIPGEDFQKIYSHIFDKINASFYHLQCLKKNEKIAIRIGKNLLGIRIPGTGKMIGIVGAPYEPIGYEYESFLITIKASLDFIAILVESCFGHKEDNIVSLMNASGLRRLKAGSLEEKIYSFLQSEEFSELIGSFKNPSKNQKSKRNYAIHRGSLPIGTINIPINNPHASILHSKALNPNDPNSHFPSSNSPDLLNYCENQFYRTCDLLIGIISILVDKKLSHGPRVSILDYKRRPK